MRFPLRLVTDRKQNNARELRVPAHGDPWCCEGRGPEETSSENLVSAVGVLSSDVGLLQSSGG